MKSREHQKLQEIYRYAHTQGCLQQTFVRYFGEEAREPCGTCSNCTAEEEQTDVTVEAQKIFSCVRRMRERFGITLTAQVLKGSKAKRVLELGFDSLPTYGLLRSHSEKEINHRIRILAAEGYLRLSEDEYPTLSLTPAAVEVLKGERQVLLRLKKPKERTTPRREDLFEELRVLRKSLSEAEQVPPYMIFPDSTLTDLARVLPMDRESMRAVKGVGEKKLEKYGDRFLAAIREYAEKQGITPDAGEQEVAATLSTEKKSDSPPSHLTTWSLWQEGKNLDEISRERGLSPTTLENHLLRAAGEGHPVDWDRLIPAGEEPLIRQAIEKVGGTLLKPIKEALPEEITYTAIKAVLAKMSDSS